MNKVVHCKKLNESLEALDRQPYPGDLGKKIYENISKKAWKMWLGHQTMLINEYRLNVIEPEARKFLEKEMDKFLFGEGSELPAGFQNE